MTTYNINIYSKFYNKINQIKNVTDFLKKKSIMEKSFMDICLTKGNTILQFFEINEQILTAISDKPDKWGNNSKVSNYLKSVLERNTRLLFCFSVAFY